VKSTTPSSIVASRPDAMSWRDAHTTGLCVGASCSDYRGSREWISRVSVSIFSVNACLLG